MPLNQRRQRLRPLPHRPRRRRHQPRLPRRSRRARRSCLRPLNRHRATPPVVGYGIIGAMRTAATIIDTGPTGGRSGFIGPTSIGAAFPGSASKDASRPTFRERRTSYFPVKCGLRRSRKALTPSFRSSLSRTGSSSLRTSATVSSGPFGMASRASLFSA